MSPPRECKSLIQAFYFDEMDGIKKFGPGAILQFLLSPRYSAVVLFRWQRIFYLRGESCHKRIMKRNVCFFVNNFIMFVIARINFSLNGGIDTSPMAQVGQYLFISNPRGVIFAGNCVVGKHLEIHQGVVIGGKNGKFPTIGNNVTIGSGAHVLGDINVGDDSVIGAMTLVIDDVEPNTIVAGIPARTLKKIGAEGKPLF